MVCIARPPFKLPDQPIQNEPPRPTKSADHPDVPAGALRRGDARHPSRAPRRGGGNPIDGQPHSQSARGRPVEQEPRLEPARGHLRAPRPLRGDQAPAHRPAASGRHPRERLPADGGLPPCRGAGLVRTAGQTARAATHAQHRPRGFLRIAGGDRGRPRRRDQRGLEGGARCWVCSWFSACSPTGWSTSPSADR